MASVGGAMSTVRVLGAGVAILALAGGAYAAARETSIFAVRTIEVSGGSGRVKAEVREALAPELGRSLVRVSGSDVSRLADAIPDVVSVHFDRSFPHTLHVIVKPERAVLLLRQGRSSWVVSARGRVMRQVTDRKRSRLPRMWIRHGIPVTVGETLPLLDGRLAAAAVAPVVQHAFRGGVRSVVSGQETLTLVLGTGTQVRLGGIGDLELKLAIAHRILDLPAVRTASSAAGYVDVSVPERPVLGS